MIKMTGGSSIIAFTTILLTLVVKTSCQDCSPCSCCNREKGCSYNNQLGIDDYCWSGCIGGFMSPKCQKTCVNPRCRSCSTESTCDTCYNGYYGYQCTSRCPTTCNTCSSSTSCTSCNDGYYGDQCQYSCPSTCKACNSSSFCTSCWDGHHSGSGAMCLFQCNPECLSCTNETSCTACKTRSGIGYYRNDCSSQCSRKCKDYLCDIYGHCLECADPHFLGSSCDRCINGKYGSLCHNNCPVNCYSDCSSTENCKYGTCYRNGSCIGGCKDEFSGSRCEQKTCPINCNCDNNNSCFECDAYHFGPSCLLSCSSCKDNRCPVERLHAKKCDECATWRYGNLCNETCPHYCLDNKCDQDNGTCVCDKNYTFKNGKCVPSSCPANCSTCTSPDVCDSCVDSSCTRCTKWSYPGSSGKCVPCEPNCSGECNSSTGVCYECVDGYRGSFCNVSCITNCKSCLQNNDECNVCKEEFWGSDCLNNCSTNCKHGNNSMSSCDINSGKCLHGCLSESHGLQCSLLCGKHCLPSEGGVRECNQMDGQCRCENGYKQTDAGCTDDQIDQNGGAGDGTSGSVIGGAVGGVLGLLTVALVIGLLIFVRRRRLDSTDGPRADAAVYQNKSASANIYNEINDKTDEVKSSKGRKNNAKESPTTSTNDNKLDRLSDSKLGVTRASTEQLKTNQLKSSEGKSEHSENSAKCKTPVEDSPKDILQDKDTDDVYYNLNKVAVKDLGAFVAAKDNSYYQEEFKKLPDGLVKPHQDALRPENRPRNRYQGIYPYDNTRVKLMGGDTDFINASFVEGYRQENAYIASQGPTDKTMQDYSVFWRMVWQQKVGKIVMLTNLVEDGKPKCDQYWPDHGITKQYSDINVTCLSEDMYADFVMRTFLVKMDKEDMTVQHFHFTSWPDKGVPDDVTSLVDFRHRVLQTKSPLGGPTIVHC
ncbi:PTPRT-like protein, partial [Mya arenaria]